jgi:hypothetical protein
MGINNYWREKQLPNSFVQQETYCIDFIKKHMEGTRSNEEFLASMNA